MYIKNEKKSPMHLRKRKLHCVHIEGGKHLIYESEFKSNAHDTIPRDNVKTQFQTDHTNMLVD